MRRQRREALSLAGIALLGVVAALGALSWAYGHDMTEAGRIPAELNAEKVLWKALSRPVGED